MAAYEDVHTFKRHLKSKHQISCTYVKTNNAQIPRLSGTSENSAIEDDSVELPEVSGSDEMDVEADNLTSQHFEESLTKCRDTFGAKQYCKPSLPRNHVQTVISDFSCFISSGPYALFGERVFSLLQKCSAPEEEVAQMKQMWNSLLNPFEGFQTDYRRLKYFEESGDFIAPVPVYLGRRLENVKNPDGSVKAVYRDVHAQFIAPSRSRVLKRFLEM